MSNMNRSLFGSRDCEDCSRTGAFVQQRAGSDPVSERECTRREREPVDVLVSFEERDQRDRHGRCRRPVEAALNAATGGAGPLPIIAIGDLTQTIPVVSVTIDADCIYDPDILLTFTTIITLPVAVAATLTFAVLRTSVNNGVPVAVGPSFTYSVTVAALSSDTFAFQLFDNDLDRGTYTYTVVLTPNTVATVAGVTLVNSTLSALAVNDSHS